MHLEFPTFKKWFRYLKKIVLFVWKHKLRIAIYGFLLVGTIPYREFLDNLYWETYFLGNINPQYYDCDLNKISHKKDEYCLKIEQKNNCDEYDIGCRGFKNSWACYTENFKNKDKITLFNNECWNLL